MHIQVLMASALALSSSPASEKALDDLAAQLRDARSSTTVAISPCPKSMEPFVGLVKDVVISKLGAPDLDELGTAADGQEIAVQQYLFAPPDVGWIGIGVSAGGWTAVLPMDGPFTVFQFHYSSTGKALAARCYDRA